jgi:hypothetical protein
MTVRRENILENDRLMSSLRAFLILIAGFFVLLTKPYIIIRKFYEPFPGFLLTKNWCYCKFLRV